MDWICQVSGDFLLLPFSLHFRLSMFGVIQPLSSYHFQKICMINVNELTSNEYTKYSNKFTEYYLLNTIRLIIVIVLFIRLNDISNNKLKETIFAQQI